MTRMTRKVTTIVAQFFFLVLIVSLSISSCECFSFFNFKPHNLGISSRDLNSFSSSQGKLEASTTFFRTSDGHSFEGYKSSFVLKNRKKNNKSHQKYRLYSTADESYPSDVDDESFFEANATEVSSSDVKQDLLLELIGTNRGFNIVSDQKENIVGLISDLEALNPTPYPTDLVNNYDKVNNISPLAGNWRLIYTNAIDVLSLGVLPTVILGRVYQNINSDLTEVTNIAEVSGGVSQLSLTPIFNKMFENVAELQVKAKSEIMNNNRISLQFKAAKFVPNKVFGLDFEEVVANLPFSLPLPNVTFKGNNIQGYIDTTYVDEEIRIGRSPGSSVFVFVREKEKNPQNLKL